MIGIDKLLVKVCDSVYRTAGTSVALQAAAILKTKSDSITFEVERTQFQQEKMTVASMLLHMPQNFVLVTTLNATSMFCTLPNNIIIQI